jgi:GNAT superfamily N-acetyltransferase
VIRRARLEDLAQLDALSVPQFEPVLAPLLEDPDACLLVAEADGKIGGYILAFKHNHRAAHTQWRVCWVEDLLVNASLRKQGIGRDLMAGVEAWALAEGFKVMALSSPRAGDFYTALGYKESAKLYTKQL